MGFQDPHIRRYVRASMAEEILDAETETQLAIAWRDHGDEAALHRLIQAYARLAVSFAGRFKRYDVPYEDLIQQGIDEGARLVAGGTGRPEGLNRGYYVRPTVFADVNNDMTIAREEIFGPVLSIIPFDSEDEAVAIANDTPYGLTNYVQSQDGEKRMRVARQLRSGMVEMNGQSRGAGSPFGGMKASGNGREGGVFGLEDFVEVKAVSGWPDA